MKFRVEVVTGNGRPVQGDYIEKIDQTFWPTRGSALAHGQKLLESNPPGTVIRGYETVENLVFEVGPVEGKKG